MSSAPRGHGRTLVVVSQAYPPDPTSVGQHVADVASAMARRGWRVVVLTSARGYEDASRVYPARETIDGVEVRRLPLSSGGKSSIAMRLLGGTSFVAQAVMRALLMPRVDLVLVSTCPPMAPAAGVLLSWLRRVPVKFWLMDMNPDQMVAIGKIGARSLPARVFDAMNRAILRRASDVVVLDRFMAERVRAKLDVSRKISILPPWPHEDHLEPVPAAENPFRDEHGLQGRRVVMYSGNHSPSNPLGTLLDAARRLRNEPGLAFLFVGGGMAKRDVEAAAAECPSIRALPYQPMERLRWSLSAGDVHVVTMGDDMVGILHPCKVYGAMAIARPILFLGPADCHVADVMREADIGWHVRHGDVDGAERVLREILAADAATLDAKGRRAYALLQGRLTKDALCGSFCDVLEHGRASEERFTDRATPNDAQLVEV